MSKPDFPNHPDEKGRKVDLIRGAMYHRRTGSEREGRADGANRAEYIWVGDSKAASGHVVCWFFTSQKPKGQKETASAMLAGEDWWLISWRPGKYILDLDYRASENFIDVA
ncbi:unnamed protein product, partial [Amoebophrya sp. A120]|eukprot:GSA120T00001494001.1